MRSILSGGGTAGHIYPALAVAERLSAGEHDELLFVGTPDGLEARLVPEAGVAFAGLPAAGFDRSRPLTLVTSSLKIATSTVRAFRLLGRFAPDVIVGFGGYVSIPVGVAARLRRVPVVLHEQNAVPGLANRLLSRWAVAAAVTYESSASYLRHPERAEMTGNPVRAAVLRSSRREGRRALGIGEDALLLVVFGGSRGARHVNQAALAIASRVLAVPGVEVLHIAGKSEVESVKGALSTMGGDAGRWRVLDYLDDMGSALAAADLVVSRAGATSIAEITALGLPAVLVPYPYATDDHQTKNASVMARTGAAVVVPDSEIEGARFGDAVLALLGDPDARATMAAASRALGRPHAAEDVETLVRDIAATGRRAGRERMTDTDSLDHHGTAE